MLTAVYFNHKFCGGTVEVRNEGANDVLFINFDRIMPRENKYQSLRSCGVISRRSAFAFSIFELSFGICIKTISQFFCRVPSQSRLRRASSPSGRAKYALSVGFAASSPSGGARFALSVGFAASSPSGGAKGDVFLDCTHDPRRTHLPLPMGEVPQCAHWGGEGT